MQGALGIFQADMNNVGAFFAEYSSQDIVAYASGGQTYATQIITQVAKIGTVATTADSVRLPPSSKGIIVYLINAGASAMQVFGYGTDTIDGVATGTGVSQPAGGSFMYICTAAGVWTSMTVTITAVTSGTIANVAINNSTVGLTTAAAGNFTTVNISGTIVSGNATLNNASVGLTTAAAGNFTNVNLSGNITVTGTANVTGASVFTGNVSLRGVTSGLNMPVRTVAANANAQGNAGVLATGFNLITAGNGTSGVILAAAGNGSLTRMFNQSNGNVLVYPPVGYTLDRNAANISANLAANASVEAIQYNGTAFFTLPVLAP